MRLRTTSDAVARLLAVAGLLLVLAAGAVEALRFASPAATHAASSPERAQDGGDVTVTPSATGDAASLSPEAGATAAPTEAATSAPTETAPPAPTEPAAAPTETPTASPTEETTHAPTEAAATATLAPTESSPAAPPPAIGDPPLRLDKSVSLPSVVPGQTFSYRLELTSGSAGAVEVRDYLDAQLEVVSASVPSGTCSVVNPVVCTATVSQGQPAVIDVTVRVRPETAVGATLVSQALVQDERRFTASSEPVVVQVAALGAAVEQGALREAALQQQAGTPTPIITEEEPLPPSTPSATAAAQPATPSPEGALLPAGTTPTPIISGEEDPEPTEVPDVVEVPTVSGPIQVTPSAQTAATAAYPAPQAPTSAATPVIRPPTRPAQAVVPLPTTSATAPIVGVGVGLIGFALILHGARRVRREHGELSARVGAFPRLRSLARTVLRLQRAAAETTAELDDKVQSLADRLPPP